MRSRQRIAVMAASLAVVGGLVVGCSSAPTAATTSAGAGETITLNVGLFGAFGYKEAGLYDKYMAAHPNIKIVESSPQNESDYWNALQTRLAGGSGLADIQALEVGRMALVKQDLADKFVDLNTMPGADEYKSEFVPWKLDLATTTDGKLLAGGTDVGPVAMCYKPKLFKAAGLPTDPDKVAALWPTWDDYVATGKKFMAANSGPKWVDSAAGLFRAASGATGERFTNKNGDFFWETSPAVQSSWKLATDAIQSGLVTKLTQFSDDWNQSFTTDDYATLVCPAWMLTYVKGQAGDKGKGDWAVTSAPGVANFGGSYLMIPKTSQHQAEAWDLLKFLTSADSQAAVFKQAGNMPTNKGALSQIADFKDPYFNNSPTGQIFSKVLNSMPTQYAGVHDGDADTAFTNALNSIAQNGTDPTKAWDDVKKSISAAVG